MVSEKIRGRIVSDKLTKTVTVLVQRQKMHPIYKKAFKVSKKYLAHDMVGAKMGDIVDIVKIRPVSKNKHWKILSVVGKDIEAVAGEELKRKADEAIAQVMPPDVPHSAEAPLGGTNDSETMEGKPEEVVKKVKTRKKKQLEPKEVK